MGTAALAFAVSAPLKAQIKDKRTVFIDSVMQSMSLDQKLGQLFMIRAFSRKDQIEDKRILEIIRKYHIGGICFFQGSPKRQKELTLYVSRQLLSPRC
jgi:beta-N-acetylhexosaminidase